MSRMYHIIDEGYNQRSSDDMLEKAFKEGYEHGYRKAMKEKEGYSERNHYSEGFEEKIERLRKKYE